MTMAASTVCKSERDTITKQQNNTEKKINCVCSSTCDAQRPDRKPQAVRHQVHSFAHLREWLEDETDGYHHQQYHERRHESCNLNTHANSASSVSISLLVVVMVLQHQFKLGR